MALLSDLVKVVAQVEGLEEVSVGIFARHAREAGFIAQGGRGRSAAKMSIKDAANLIIAVNGCSLAKDVPVLLERIRGLNPYPKNDANSEGLGKKGHTFGDDLEFLLERYHSEKNAKWRDEMGPPLHIGFMRPEIMVEIELVDRTILRYIGGGDHFGDGPDRLDRTEISSRTLRAVARAL